MNILDQLRARHGLPKVGNLDTQSNNGQDIQQRLNFMTCGNILELGTEVVFGLMKSGDGLATSMGENRLFKRDIAAMIAAKLTRRVQNVVDKMGSN